MSSSELPAEFRRALAAPTKQGAASAIEFDAVDQMHLSGDYVLNCDQMDALVEISRARGGVISLGVGRGKTLIALLAPRILGIHPDKVVYLVPAKLQDNLRAEWRKWKPHFDVAPPRHIVSHGSLSSKLQRDILHRIKPTLLIIDEMHKFTYDDAKPSLRSRRLYSFLYEHEDCMCIGLSATILFKGWLRAMMPIEAALAEASPLPRQGDHCRVLDWVSKKEGTARIRRKALPLVNALSPVEFPQTFLHDRHYAAEATQAAKFTYLSTKQGVVIDASVSCRVPIILSLLTYPKGTAAVVPFITKCEALRMLPDGMALDDDQMVSFRRTAAVGFYYRTTATKRYKQARRDYVMSTWEFAMTEVAEDLDSAGLVADAARRGDPRVSTYVKQAVAAWDVAKHEVVVRTAEWFTDTIIDDQVAWLARGKDRILWFAFKATQARLRSKGVLALSDDGGMPPAAGGRVALSRYVFAEGQNLQDRWSVQRVMAPPPAAADPWDQLIGRTHRQGQQADEVTVEVLQHTETYKGAMKSALDDAKRVENETGVLTRLNLADIIRVPE